MLNQENLGISTPLVTVLMPAFNAEKYVAEAIESVLEQTYQNFEFIIINDGSTDNTEKIIYRYNDPRIVYIRNESNIRLVATLNKGIRIARGKYIMRMDADDISVVDRMKLQVAFMEQYPEIGVCGSFLSVFGETIKPYLSKRPEMDEDIRARMLVCNSIGHPNVMIKKSVMIDNNVWYDETYYRMEDWGLWISLMPYCKFYNIQLPLILYRYVETSESRINSKDSRHLEISAELVKLYFSKLDIPCNVAESRLIAALIKSPHVFRLSKNEIKDSYYTLEDKFKKAELKVKGVTEHTLKRIAAFSLKSAPLALLLIKSLGIVDYLIIIIGVLQHRNTK